MPRIKKRVVRDYKICAVVSTISKEFYVLKTYGEDPRWLYKHHAQQKSKLTREFFKRSREAESFPKMYLLTEVSETAQKAFNYEVVWTKYFAEHGYTPPENETMHSYIEDLTENNEKLYADIKDIPLEDVLNEKKLLVSHYNVGTTPSEKEESGLSKATKRITLHMSPPNYELISYKAAEARMSMSKYCQMMAINGAYTPITADEYLNELKEDKITLRIIFAAFLQKGKYYPADIKNVQKLVVRVEKNQKKACKDFDQQVENLLGYTKLKRKNSQLRKEIKELKEALKRRANADALLQKEDHEDVKMEEI